MTITVAARPVSGTQDVARKVLGAFLLTTGTGHLTFARRQYQAQVPPWIPMNPDTVVLASGVVELAVGAATLAAKEPRQRARMGAILAGLFVAVFPGNIAQYTHRRDALGLDTDTKRFVRLFFQPLLVAWAIWSTGARPRRTG